MYQIPRYPTPVTDRTCRHLNHEIERTEKEITDTDLKMGNTTDSDERESLKSENAIFQKKLHNLKQIQKMAVPFFPEEQNEKIMVGNGVLVNYKLNGKETEEYFVFDGISLVSSKDALKNKIKMIPALHQNEENKDEEKDNKKTDPLHEMGNELLGKKVGDKVTVKVPGGEAKITVLRIDKHSQTKEKFRKAVEVQTEPQPEQIQQMA